MSSRRLLGVFALVAAALSGCASHSVAKAGDDPVTAAPGGTTTVLTQVPVDYWSNYWKRFPNGPDPTGSPSYFPVNVWFECVNSTGDSATDRAAGLNGYLVMCDGSQPADIAPGMGAWMQVDWLSGTGLAAVKANPTKVVGWNLGDEVDMDLGPGAGTRHGYACPSGPCGFTFLNQESALFDSAVPNDGRPREIGYGKGVLFWESLAQAQTFVRDWGDVISADTYWYTDTDACSQSQGGAFFGLNRALTPTECHRAGNYGAIIDHLRALEDPAHPKPVWAVIEVGHPSTNQHVPNVTPAQVTASTWSSIVHGANGIIYFNHSFGGNCQGDHDLREGAASGACYAAVRAAVTENNSQIEALAPVLNQASIPGVTVRSASGPRISTMLKSYGGHLYLFAMSDFNVPGTAPTTQTITIPGAHDTSATVINQAGDRVRVTDGKIVDTFNPYEVRIYELGT